MQINTTYLSFISLVHHTSLSNTGLILEVKGVRGWRHRPALRGHPAVHFVSHP